MRTGCVRLLSFVLVAVVCLLQASCSPTRTSAPKAKSDTAAASKPSEESVKAEAAPAQEQAAAPEQEPKQAPANPQPSRQASKPRADVKQAPAKPAPAQISGTSKAASKGAETSSKVKTRPKLVELGATKCIPCKMMAPILEELKEEYKGSLEVILIDVWENRDEAEKYGVQTIPTQIFYDENGKEFFRHVGFFAKENIIDTFAENGIKLTRASERTKNPR